MLRFGSAIAQWTDFNVISKCHTVDFFFHSFKSLITNLVAGLHHIIGSEGEKTREKERKTFIWFWTRNIDKDIMFSPWIRNVERWKWCAAKNRARQMKPHAYTSVSSCQILFFREKSSHHRVWIFLFLKEKMPDYVLAVCLFFASLSLTQLLSLSLSLRHRVNKLILDTDLRTLWPKRVDWI